MLLNLKAEMARYGVSTNDIHTAIDKTARATTEKIAGRAPFTIQEALKIRDTFFIGMSLEYLFQDFQDSAAPNASAKTDKPA